ncbi:V-type ATP synthase subunit D [Acetobacteroides hydrogenigenes]|uniref:V/A-type H+-transporting ATPase subunit D n=1 Tax=Acetobacteroides hydrogenigenes TaxID=979970 RepID=A0A4R2EA23_9BACT|nr:V-type ATP synthase subunit D [Acetobacteroides hydrogenigenes]TCN62714.1 V/A-type H+-transporting ATPase subunit D [Acetobacteroides hydrogenigenes]
MGVKYQINKTALNELNKQLRVRKRALPTIKNKESALRLEVKKAKNLADEVEARQAELTQKLQYMSGLWTEFRPELITVEDVKVSLTKIAGVKIPVLKEVIFTVHDFDLFSSPFWIVEGLQILKELTTLGIEREFYLQKMRLLDHARKKTTQKVNLYEKVQIPDYESAIRKIKRFLEDEENLSKSAQKIVKKRYEEVAE